jgi:rod shape-determining protein MreD
VSALAVAVALLLALLVQSGLSLALPEHTVLLDPFLLAIVYFALSRGEEFGLWVGTAAGWVQEVYFGGPVVGLLALSRLLIGFAVGAAGARLMLASAGARMLVLFAATLVDGRLVEWLAAVFELPLDPLPVSRLLLRAGSNALLGVAVFGAVDRARRRLRQE